MEYLMSYGWAIMIVMIVGIAMYRLDIFNMGGGMSPTSQGFTNLKPLLATCKMSSAVFFNTFDGFECQFVNGGGDEIVIRDIDATVNGQHCRWPIVDSAHGLDTTTSHYVWRICPNVNDCVSLPNCRKYPGGAICAANDYPRVRKDATFFVYVVSHSNPADPGHIGQCVDIESDVPYEVELDITYEQDIGEVTARKHSIGKVVLSA